MFFKDYKDTGYIYHVAAITDLKEILESGIKYNDKETYESKYLDFHKYIDSYKTENIPKWVKREHAIYATMNYHKNHDFHSHSVVLGIKINPEKCWVASESLANKIYEPFILKEIDIFNCANDYLKKNGDNMCEEYWETSISFLENIKVRRDKNEKYDDEVLIFHDIKPEDIKPLYIVSDQEFTTVENWISHFSK